MQVSDSMLKARSNILANGIQQTNRYRFLFSPMNVALYPYEIILPGLGYESIDHSVWSRIRKIPFRKSYTDLQVKFIIGKVNYAHFINLWNNVMSSPYNNTPGPPSDADVLRLLLNNGVTPSIDGDSTESAGNLQRANQTTTSNSFIDAFLYTRTPFFVGNAYGGAPEYTNYIASSYCIVSLISENSAYNSNTDIIFNEAYITQIQPTQFTSVETGYSTFTVNFKFSSINAYSSGA